MTTRLPIPITEDRGIWKWTVETGDPCQLPPNYSKGTRVRLHYTCHTIPFEKGTQGSHLDADDPFKSGLALVRLMDPSRGGPQDTDSDTDSIESDHHPHRPQSQPADGTKAMGPPSHVDPHQRILVGHSRDWNGGPLEFRTGYGFKVPMVELAVKTMRMGERARFYCQPVYAEPWIQFEANLRTHRRQASHPTHAHGHMCAGHGMDKDADRDLYQLFGCPLEVEIQLLAVDSAGTVPRESWECSAAEKLEQAVQLKQQGNHFVQKSSQLDGAIRAYKTSLGLLETVLHQSLLGLDQTIADDSLVTRARSLQTTTQLNLAACYLKQRQFEWVEQLCSLVLDREPMNGKALLRRCRATWLGRRDFGAARRDLKRFRDLCRTPADWASYRHECLQLEQEERSAFAGLPLLAQHRAPISRSETSQ